MKPQPFLLPQDIAPEYGCFDIGGGLGCTNSTCEKLVCDGDSSCCDVGWDANCAYQACNKCTGATPANCTACNIQVGVTTDFYPSETTWTILQNPYGSNPVSLLTGGPYAEPETMFTTSRNVANSTGQCGECYRMTVLDSQGDGIFAPGRFTIKYRLEDYAIDFIDGSEIQVEFGECP